MPAKKTTRSRTAATPTSRSKSKTTKAKAKAKATSKPKPKSKSTAKRRARTQTVGLVARLLPPKGVPASAVRLPGGPRELAALAFLRIGNDAVIVGRSELRELGITPEALARLAVQGVAEHVPVDVAEVADGIFTVANDRIPFVSGYALDLARVPGLPRLGEEGALVGIPNAHLLLVRPLARRGLDGALHRMVPALLGTYADAASPLTQDLYWVRGGTWTRMPLETKGTEIHLHLAPELERLL